MWHILLSCLLLLLQIWKYIIIIITEVEHCLVEDHPALVDKPGEQPPRQSPSLTLTSSSSSSPTCCLSIANRVAHPECQYKYSPPCDSSWWKTQCLSKGKSSGTQRCQYSPPLDSSRWEPKLPQHRQISGTPECQHSPPMIVPGGRLLWSGGEFSDFIKSISRIAGQARQSQYSSFSLKSHFLKSLAICTTTVN